jgi:hypothetical protein
MVVGLIWAQFENVSLRKIAEESGHAGEVVQGPPKDETPIEEPSGA